MGLRGAAFEQQVDLCTVLRAIEVGSAPLAGRRNEILYDARSGLFDELRGGSSQ